MEVAKLFLGPGLGKIAVFLRALQDLGAAIFASTIEV
jgi:hypothetical protein